jgi:hypothetical protein
MEQDMKSLESRVVMTEAQHAAIKVAAERSGNPLATFQRWCALLEAETMGVHTNQPRAD